MTSPEEMWDNFIAQLNKEQPLPYKDGHKNFLGSIEKYKGCFCALMEVRMTEAEINLVKSALIHLRRASMDAAQTAKWFDPQEFLAVANSANALLENLDSKLPNLACKSVQKRLAAQWGYVKVEDTFRS